MFCVGEWNSFQWLCRSIRLFLPYFTYLGFLWCTCLVYCVVSFNIKSCVAHSGGNLLNAKTLKYGILASLIILASFTGVMYALAYTVKSEVIYTTETFKINGQEQLFKPFYLSSPAAVFEVKLSVSKGTIKWTPYSAELLDATLDSFQSQKNEATYDALQGWECETDNGAVKWRIDS